MEIRSCPNCESPLRTVKGRFGDFWGCSNYPECKFTEKIATTSAPQAKNTTETPTKGLSVGQILALILENTQDSKKTSEDTKEMLEEYLLSIGHEKKNPTQI